VQEQPNLGFNIWIDNDACPRRIRELVFKAAKRLKLQVYVVANSFMRLPKDINAKMICVGSHLDAADDYIADNVGPKDIVITEDVPLASRIVEKDAVAISPRGRLFDTQSINEQLAMRNLRQELRSSGQISGGQGEFDVANVNRFAALLDKLLMQRVRSKL
jgi:uncharacterized protein YaiI (UPF0178 family)